MMPGGYLHAQASCDGKTSKRHWSACASLGLNHTELPSGLHPVPSPGHTPDHGDTVLDLSSELSPWTQHREQGWQKSSPPVFTLGRAHVASPGACATVLSTLVTS